MDSLLPILLDYSVLGCWVVYSVIREKALMKRMQEQSDRFHKERVYWLKTLSRKGVVGDATISEITGI